jgi:hypothetical protein
MTYIIFNVVFNVFMWLAIKGMGIYEQYWVFLLCIFTEFRYFLDCGELGEYLGTKARMFLIKMKRDII